jgi:hypothetical protein
MIAQCLAIGRSVLFVSQKTAALEVVQRRLEEIGLGGYCLEIHSTKAQKSNVLARLKSAWYERQVASSAGWAGATSDLSVLKDELNALVAALHRPRANGLSTYEAFGRVVAGEATGIVFALDWKTIGRRRPRRSPACAVCSAISARCSKPWVTSLSILSRGSRPSNGRRAGRPRWLACWIAISRCCKLWGKRAGALPLSWAWKPLPEAMLAQRLSSPLGAI